MDITYSVPLSLPSPIVCNEETGSECVGCEPATICNDVGVEKGTCCTNFFDVIEFAKLVINTLASVQSEQMYSVVGFATEVTRRTLLLPPDVAIQALDGLEYSGGRTNHADAITACQGSLTTLSAEGRTSLMILITDDDPSEPRNSVEGSAQVIAEEAAAQAKGDGVFIIPVMIAPQSSTLSPELEYLQGISSDGQVFGVSDFDVLDSLQESLLDQISCQI